MAVTSVSDCTLRLPSDSGGPCGSWSTAATSQIQQTLVVNIVYIFEVSLNFSPVFYIKAHSFGYNS